MNKAKLKSYAPQARLDFIAAVTARANLLGLSEKAGRLEVAPAQTQGDVTLIAGQAWPAKVEAQREQLVIRMRREGFPQTCEAVAYTWFNRFAALRYMELHDYLGHGHRALSSAEGGLPDILTYASDLVHAGDSGLPGLKAELVTEMKLAGNRDSELYRMLLVAQCNALSRVMPFLFERIDDDSELLLPDNLLRSDSVIAKLVEEIPEEDWAEVEIIGWLYQFYISNKKDQVIGKVVKSEDIPAATQLFTPNWIVQYLVQNSVGRLWLIANPQSTLAKDWPYYITPAEQTPEVQDQLDALIQTRVREDGDTLNPESITVLDPACGSGHILVVAYEVLKSIYLERGYQPRVIPRLMLEKNLFGLDIDDRAAQMAGFALMMKARADDRRLFGEPINLNVLSLQESKGMDANNLTQALHSLSESANLKSSIDIAGRDFVTQDLFPESHQQSSLGESTQASEKTKELNATIAALIAIFSNAKTFGSLIMVPGPLSANLLWLKELLSLAFQKGDLYAKSAAQDLMPLVAQAQLLGMQFDAVVANPPYMGSKGMNTTLKNYGNRVFPESKSDLFAMFIDRGFQWCKPFGLNGMVTMQSWMFLSSYEGLRKKLLANATLSRMLHMGNGVMGIAFGTAATIFFRTHVKDYLGYFCYCSNDDINESGVPFRFPIKNEKLILTKSDDFSKIPGSPIAYWMPEAAKRSFMYGTPLGDVAKPRQGLATADNDRFRRNWYEVSLSKIGFNNYSENKKWFPYNSGGGFRKWFGNQLYVVNWESNGLEIRQDKLAKLALGTCRPGNSTPHNTSFYFHESISWSKVTSGGLSLRYFPPGFIFDVAGCSIFQEDSRWLKYLLGLLNSSTTDLLLGAMSATLNFEVGQIKALPVINLDPDSSEFISITQNVERCIEISKKDWSAYEYSWSFDRHPILFFSGKHSSTIKSCYEDLIALNKRMILEMQELEECNNLQFINGYHLNESVISNVSLENVTLTANPAYRYSNQASEDENLTKFKQNTMEDFVSFMVGCMMGRYSLDQPGLIYACAGNVDFDLNRYLTFPADADGILPITDELWFDDDVSVRIREFLHAVWGAGTLEENIAWLAEGLGSKAGETSDETIRRYVADKFFKDHLQTYKKRPIYWLFSSGKYGAFQALVYLHRYNEGTLARMRAEYVVPLTSKIQSRIEMLEKDVNAASSTVARNKLTKEVEKLKKKHVELLAYDEQLRHYADMRITLDLDDGVKVNYGKFGDLLAEVKAVTGGASDE